MTPEVYALSPEQCFAEAWGMALEVKKALEEEYKGLVLGEPEMVASVVSQSYARPFDPIALRLHQDALKEGQTITYRSDRLAFDNSKGFPEFETTNRITAVDDFRAIMDFFEDLVRSGFNLRRFLKEFGEVMKRIGMLVSPGSRDMSSSFTVRQSGSKDLSYSLYVRNKTD